MKANYNEPARGGLAVECDRVLRRVPVREVGGGGRESPVRPSSDGLRADKRPTVK